MRVIFMGTPTFAVPAFTAIHEAGHDMVAVYTQPPRPSGRGQKETQSAVHQTAAALGLPVYTPTSLKDAATQQAFAAHQADVAVVAAYGLLLPPAILAACRYGCLNLHASLLPRWRGAAPIQRAIMAGDQETGIVITQMNEGLDTGDMLLLQRIPIREGVTAGMLQEELATIGASLIVETLARLPLGDLPRIQQPTEGVTYAAKIRKEEGRLYWQEDAVMLERRIRGLLPSPGAHFLLRGELIKVHGARVIPLATPQPPGKVLDERLTIACGHDALGDWILQRPGKTAMKATDMLRGHPVAEGEMLLDSLEK